MNAPYIDTSELELVQTVIWAATSIIISLIFAPLVKYVVRRLLEVKELQIRSCTNTEDAPESKIGK